MIIIAFVIFISGLFILWQSLVLLKKEGLTEGHIIYTDTHLWNKVTAPLYDYDLKLTGKPDYIIQSGKQFIPIEVKTGKPNSIPTEAHILQLAAYCYLIQHNFHQRPKYGIIHYIQPSISPKTNKSVSFKINYTNDLENRLLSTINQIRSIEKSKEPCRSHQSPYRCNHCGYHHICNQKLIDP